ALAGLLVGVDRNLALAGLDDDRNDLVDEGPRLDRVVGAGQRGDRVLVHLGAGELVLVRRGLGEGAHRTTFLVGVLEPVEEHVVVSRVVADARARAMLLEQVGSVGHALHAAGDDQVDGAHGERLGAHDHGLHAAAADLVDGGRLDRLGQPGLERGLARGCLAEPGGQHAAHVDPFDGLALNPRALDRRPDRGRAELCRRDVRQCALHPSHRGARVGQDDDRVGFVEYGHGERRPLATGRKDADYLVMPRGQDNRVTGLRIAAIGAIFAVAALAVPALAQTAPWRNVEGPLRQLTDIAAIEQLARDHPHSSNVRLALLNVYLEAEMMDAALLEIEFLAERGYRFSEAGRAALLAAFDDGTRERLEALFAAGSGPIEASVGLATVPVEAELVEALAWRGDGEALFASTIVSRALYRRAGQGPWQPVELPVAGSLGGLVYDDAGGTLWISSGVYEQTPDPESAFRGLIGYSPDDGSTITI